MPLELSARSALIPIVLMPQVCRMRDLFSALEGGRIAFGVECDVRWTLREDDAKLGRVFGIGVCRVVRSEMPVDEEVRPCPWKSV